MNAVAPEGFKLNLTEIFPIVRLRAGQVLKVVCFKFRITADSFKKCILNLFGSVNGWL